MQKGVEILSTFVGSHVCTHASACGVCWTNTVVLGSYPRYFIPRSCAPPPPATHAAATPPISDEPYADRRPQLFFLLRLRLRLRLVLVLLLRGRAIGNVALGQTGVYIYSYILSVGFLFFPGFVSFGGSKRKDIGQQPASPVLRARVLVPRWVKVQQLSSGVELAMSAFH